MARGKAAKDTSEKDADRGQGVIDPDTINNILAALRNIRQDVEQTQRDVGRIQRTLVERLSVRGPAEFQLLSYFASACADTWCMEGKCIGPSGSA